MGKHAAEGMVVGGDKRSPFGAPKLRMSKRRLAILLALTLVLVIAAGAAYGYTHYRTKKPQQAAQRKKSDHVILDLQDKQITDSKSPGEKATNIAFKATLVATNGDTNQAITLYKQALAVDPNNVAALEGLGRTYLTKQDKDNALKYYNQEIAVLQKDPKNPAAQNIPELQIIVANVNKGVFDLSKMQAPGGP
jgi:tetratricopeptide (TPR) repeat protein